MTFTRLTVVGASRRADVVVPDDETFAALLPDLLDLLGEAAHFTGAPVRLVRRTGEQVELAATPGELAVVDGDVLRIVHEEEAPPPPEVADVTEVVAEALEGRGDRWGETARYVVGALAVGIAAVLLGYVASRGLDDSSAVAVLGGTWIAALVVAVLGGRLRRPWTNTWATALALGLSLPLAQAVPLEPGATGLLRSALLAAVLVSAALGVGFGIARRRTPPAWGALAGVGGAGTWLALSYTVLPPTASAGLVGLAALVVIGILPSIALATSGLSTLDDAAIAGELPSRPAVATSLEDAYASLAWLSAPLALTVGAAACLLALSGELYALLLAIAMGLVLSLRTRQFPLTVHVVPLWAASVAVLVAVSASPLLPGWAGIAMLIGLGAAGVTLAGIRPTAHARVRLRRWGNVLELFAVLSTVPLLLGVLAVYPDLLQVFP